MSLWHELHRRNVVKVGVTYAVMSWLLIQIAVSTFPNLGLPDWASTLVIVLLLLGSPVALLLAWAYEITPDGVKRTKHVPLAQSLARMTGQKLNYLITGLLVIAVAFMAADDYLFQGAQTQAAALPAAAAERSPPMSFVIDAPEGSNFELAQMFPHPALSPDGSQLAFVAPSRADDDALTSTAPRVIWVQRLGSLEAQPLAGTDDAAFPFWSPDGRNVAFGAGQRLKRIGVNAAGATQDVAQFDGFFGGSWGADGFILFASRKGIFRVAAAGGDPVPVTRIADADPDYAHRFPVLFPDGQRFLYLVVNSDPALDGLHVGSLSDPTLRKRITSSDSNGMLATGADGRINLLFVRNNVLVAQEFDLENAALRGDVQLLASPIEPGAGGRLAPFSAAGRALVYRPRYQPDTQLNWIDRRGAALDVVGGSRSSLSYPNLSRDGSRLAAVSSTDANLSRDILWFDLVRNLNERLVTDAEINVMPVWSADASHVLFTTVRSASQYDIYQQELAASGKPEPVVQGLTGAKYLRDVTADGRFAIFQANLNDIWVAPLDGPARPYPLMETAAVENHARVSPNGNWLAYSATEVGGTSQIYVTTFPVPGARQRVSVSGGADPQWRGDGQELYFAASNGMLMSVAVSDGATLELGTPEPMFRISPDPWSLSFGSVYAPAPDGQKFLVSETVGNSDVRLIVMLNWSVVTPDR